MNAAELTKYAIAGGLLFALYKFAPNAMVKGAVIGVAGTIVAKRTPFLKDVV